MTTAVISRMDDHLAVSASRLARWRGESLSKYVARLVAKDVESQRHTLKALADLEAQGEQTEGGAS